MATTAIPQKKTGFIHSALEAIRGTHQDFTEGSISRAIFLLATPMVLEMLMESLFAIVNVFWVTRLGSDAIAAVGLTESMLTIVFSVALGVSLSTTAMVARRIGEKDTPGAATAAGQAILLGVGVSALIGIPGFIFAESLLGLMGATPSLIATGKTYTAITLGNSLVVMLLFLNNAIFRGAGDASVAMRVLFFSNLINLILDPCLIFGWGPFPALGLTGAAFSTLIGRSLGVVYQFWILFKGNSRVVLRPANLVPSPAILGSLIKVSSTGVLQFLIAHTSWVGLVRMITVFGSNAVAGYTIGLRIFVFVILPSWGFSGAAATMVGQNLGAKRPDRAERAVYLTSFYNMIYLGLIAVIFVAMPETLVNIFTTDPGIAGYAVDCLRIIGYGNITYAFGMVMVQAFNGAGDTITPTWINIVGFWLCEIPLAWFLAFKLDWQVKGIFASIPLAELLIAGLGLFMFLKGDWKTRQI